MKEAEWNSTRYYLSVGCAMTSFQSLLFGVGDDLTVEKKPAKRTALLGDEGQHHL